MNRSFHPWSMAALVLAACSPKVMPAQPAGGAGTDAAAPPAASPDAFTFNVPDVAPFEAAPPAATVPSTGPWGGTYVDPALPADAPKMFSGRESPAAAPAIVYPLDGSLHPTNLFDITVQWRPGSVGQTLFRLRFENDRGRYDIYAGCTEAECRYPLPEESWRAVAGLNRDRDVRLSITAAGRNGGPDAASLPVSLHFSATRVEGGLYYWSTSLEGSYRLTLGQKKAVPFITPPKSGCYGCHAVSRNGQRIAWTDMSGSVGPFRAEVLRVAPTDAPATRAGDGTTSGATMALSPDGARVLVADNSGALTLRDAATAAAVATVDKSFTGGKAAFFPEWSPDGQNIALAVGTSLPVEIALGFNLGDSDIAVMPFNGGKFGPARVVVAHDRDIHFYPSWSPDGKWLVFVSAPAGDHAQSYNNAQARLRLVAAGGGPVYELGRATQGTGHTSSWPKFTPFSQLGGQLLFVAFSSKIDYGFVVRGGTTPQLWLAAIDLRRLAGGDPSWAPVWLPFQEPDQNNHLPFWTEALGCAEDADCGPGATCKSMGCVPDRVIE
jgi:hypothetical protein